MALMDNTLLAAAIAALTTLAVGLGGALLGKRWGLPGLGREVQEQQAHLIGTLRDEVSELRQQRADDEKRISELETCQQDLANMERRLRRAEQEVLDLYRQVGKRPPVRRP